MHLAQAGFTAAVGRNCDGLRNNGSLCRLQSMLSSELGNAPLCVVVVHGQSLNHAVLNTALALRDSGRLRLAQKQMFERFALIFTASSRISFATFWLPTLFSSGLSIPWPILVNPFCKLPH
uniref:(northern house mosquito) hypothetical protein n=1 Tax=Culex pipiens TaxID=7175 RepID=A0A8D8JWG0_CULPI